MGARRVALLAGGCLVLFLVGSAQIGVVDRDEARFALAVREMADRGDWIVPTNWGELRFQKPILAYWLGGASWSLLGRSELGLRLPSALCATAAVLLLAITAARRYGAGVGWRAGWILATSLMWVVTAHAFTADAALVFGTTVSFLAWERLREEPRRAAPLRVVFWLAVAWGALAKLVNVGFLAAAAVALELLRAPPGPRGRRLVFALVAVGALAVAVPGLGFLGPLALAALAGFAALRAWRRPSEPNVPSLGLLWGIPLAVGLFAAWGVPALLRTEGAFWTLGVEGDLMGRTARPFEGHAGVPGYYLATTLLVFAPWGALLPAALRSAIGRMRHEPRLLFPLAWVLGPLVLLELVTSKLPHYMLVTFPALAVLVAVELRRREETPPPVPGRARRLEATIGALGPAALAVAAIVLAVALPGARLRTTAVLFAVLAAGVAVANARALRGATPPALFRTLAASSALLYLGAFGALFPALESTRIAEPLAEAVARQLRPGEPLLLHDFQPSSVGFALPVPPELLRDPRQVVPRLRAGGLLVVPNSERKPRLDLILKEDPLEIEKLEVVRGHVLWRLREREIWLVRAARTAAP